MAADIDTFIRVRPFLYHVTARENVRRLQQTQLLAPAAALMREFSRSDLLRWRRALPVTMQAGIVRLVLSDQAHLSETETVLARGWSFGDYVEYLNEHVFFWPGNADGPAKSGRRLPQRYDEAGSITLRLPTADVFTENPEALPLFCGFNLVAAREIRGRPVRRGPRLFSPAWEFMGRESDVIELAFRTSVKLPGSVCLRNAGEWVTFSSLAA